MDDYDGGVFYKKEIEKLIEESEDIDLLDLVYKILIEAKKPDICVMTTYDLEKGVRTTIEAKVIEEGKFILNAQKFNQTIRVMGGEEITLTGDEYTVLNVSSCCPYGPVPVGELRYKGFFQE